MASAGLVTIMPSSRSASKNASSAPLRCGVTGAGAGVGTYTVVGAGASVVTGGGSAITGGGVGAGSVVDGTILSSGPDGTGAATALDVETAGAAVGLGSVRWLSTYQSTTARMTTTAAMTPA